MRTVGFPAGADDETSHCIIGGSDPPDRVSELIGTHRVDRGLEEARSVPRAAKCRVHDELRDLAVDGRIGVGILRGMDEGKTAYGSAFKRDQDSRASLLRRGQCLGPCGGKLGRIEAVEQIFGDEAGIRFAPCIDLAQRDRFGIGWPREADADVRGGRTHFLMKLSTRPDSAPCDSKIAAAMDVLRRCGQVSQACTASPGRPAMSTGQPP